MKMQYCWFDDILKYQSKWKLKEIFKTFTLSILKFWKKKYKNSLLDKTDKSLIFCPCGVYCKLHHILML